MKSGKHIANCYLTIHPNQQKPISNYLITNVKLEEIHKQIMQYTAYKWSFS